MSTLPTTIERLSEQMGQYALLMETFSAKIRNLPNAKHLYDAAAIEWAAVGPSSVPPREHEDECREYLATLDKFCKGNDISTPPRCFLAIFAAFAGLNMLNDYHVLYLGQKDGAEVSNAINKYVMDRLDTPDPVDPHFLSQFQAALQISQTLEIGNILQYQTPEGVIQDCTIVDCGTSKLGRVWYAVIFGGDNEKVIFKAEMEDRILSHLVCRARL